MRNIKSIRVLIVQQPSPDRDTLYRHLTRVGFLTEINWPPSPQIFEMADVVFVAFRVVTETGARLNWNPDAPPAAMVALLDYENPAIMKEAVRLGAHAVLALPIQSFGAVANIYIALNNYEKHKDLNQSLKRLKTRISSEKLMAKAKEVLIRRSGISEEDAYKSLRTQAMNKRVSMQEIAKSIVYAEDILSEASVNKQARLTGK